MRPSFSSATCVVPEIEISSVPSLPWTSHAASEPSSCSVSAMGKIRSIAKAPVSCRFTPAGLVSGPRMLKIVFEPSSCRTGMTCFIAGWCIGAIMKPIPASRRPCSTISGPTMTFTPNSCSASAAPDFDERLRLPCLATGTPAPATTKAVAVEMLSVPLPSPPVPTMSIAPSGGDLHAFGPHHLGGGGVFGDAFAARAHRHQEARPSARASRCPRTAPRRPPPPARG
jgi:hypothetical protein